MDRNSIIGIVLIALVVGVWVFLQSSSVRKDVTPQATEQRREQQDSAAAAIVPAKAAVATPSIQAGVPIPAERMLTVETDLLRLRLSSRGAVVRSWKLKDYQPWYKASDPLALVDLVQPNARELGFSFRTTSGAKVKATDLVFTWMVDRDSVRVSGNDVVTIRGVAQVAGGGTIERLYTLRGNQYAITTSVVLDNLDHIIPPTNRNITLEWRNGLRFQEKNSVDESGTAAALCKFGGELDELDAQDFGSYNETTQKGNIQFLATRTKYFALAFIPPSGYDGSVSYAGTKVGAPDEGFTEQYRLLMQLPYKGGKTRHDIQVYGGPMHYDTLAAYGLTDVMNFGFKWIVKPIGEYFMLPLLHLVHSGIANWGIAIIVFSIIMKLLLYPLSIPQMKSAQKMRLLAPLMNDIREKYKDDMQSQQQEMMKLYSRYGINPAGGCLPLLLQMPFLYALYSVLNSNIEMRQAQFLPFWITDLSIPDVILDLGFKLPLFGIDKFSGLALFMGVTLFFQQKQAITDPRQKAMVYMMPVMFTLMFSALPAGLNLYYFMFNLMGIGQQIYMNSFSKNRPTLAQLEVLPKKEGWLQRKMREAQEITAAQGKGIPGQTPPRKPNSPKPNNRNKKR